MGNAWRGALAAMLAVACAAGCPRSQPAAVEPSADREPAAPAAPAAVAGAPGGDAAVGESSEAAPGPSTPVVVDPERREAARQENRKGLAHHRRRRFVEARARFEKAVEIDPTLAIARFNAACAASLGGDLVAARAHVEAYLDAEPHDASRVLHDPDLERLRAEEGFLAELRRRVRPAGATVASLVVERREAGGDIVVVSEDGLDERALAAEPDVREYRAAVTADGSRVLFLASAYEKRPVVPRKMGEGHPQRDWSDLRQQGRLYERRWDHELRSAPVSGGAAAVLATKVHFYRLHEDGRTALVVTEPEAGTYRVSAIPAAGGEARPLAEVPEASVWCPALLPDGSLVVASGRPHPWVSTLKIRVARYRGGTEEVLVPEKRPPRTAPAVPDFQLCALSPGGAELHLGLVRVVLVPEPRLVYLEGLDLGTGAYNFRNVGSRGAVFPGAEPGLVLTVVGTTQSDEEDYEGSSFALWQTSPLGWTNDNGMGPLWWSETVVTRLEWSGADPRPFEVDRGVSLYGPSVSPDGRRVAFTELRPRGDPWVVISDESGANRRRVAPGQYPVWIPGRP